MANFRHLGLQGPRKKILLAQFFYNLNLKPLHETEDIIEDTSIIQDVTTFDIYEGENIPKDKKSVALNVVIQSSVKTLKEEDLNQITKKIISTVENKTGAKIRS